MFYTQQKTSTSILDKKDCIIVTSIGNSQKIIDIIRSIDTDEFDSYGTIDGIFHIPIVELATDKCGNIDISSITRSDYGYGYKFDMDVELVISLCEKDKIPFYFDFLSPVEY